MNNKTLFGIMFLLFNCIGVPLFMQGDWMAGIFRILCWALAPAYFVDGIIKGIAILQMTDEEFEAKKATIRTKLSV